MPFNGTSLWVFNWLDHSKVAVGAGVMLRCNIDVERFCFVKIHSTCKV